ncbi:hypothetical protein J1N35_032035 [Gossypium stocksii]|uniref:Uncharacterized protein n=1 Tax=Gossypium stocksii TaxID=47602 RepID=A0A9D3V2T0_9ROSI|nr:hypothetical protein J1N35_032035 [Gossypium stocksii]
MLNEIWLASKREEKGCCKRWEKPQVGVVKVNSDGAWGLNERAGIGVVVRNDCCRGGDVEVPVLEKLVAVLGVILEDGFLASELENMITFVIMSFDPPEMKPHQ